MTAMRPSSDPQFPNKMNSPIFPPSMNGITRPSFPPNFSPSSTTLLNQPTYQNNPTMVSSTQQYQHNSNPTPPISSTNNYNIKANPTPPPATNHYNPLSHHQATPPPTTTHSPSPQPSIRPMYPSPASAYRPQITSQISNSNSQPTVTTPPSVSNYPYPQFTSPIPNSNFQPNSPFPPPPPPPPSGSAYPHPQYASHPNVPLAPYLGHPGQPQPTPHAINTTGTMNSQINNINGFPPNNISNNTNLVDLLKEKSVVSPFAEDLPVSPLLTEENQQMNCSPEVMRCSLNVIPQTKDLLNKSRLPFGVLIHPFKDLESLSVIQGSKIVRCDACKSYINPFVTFFDNTRWRCSVCFRTNNLPQEFLFDPVTKTYGDPSRRPEVRFGTVEYAATADYMARPPQPAIYLFLLDVSHNAIQTGYLQSFCDILFENLSNLPGDARTQIGFITYDTRIHLYDLSDRRNSTFRIMVLPDLENIENKIDEILPLPDGLLVTLDECRTIIEAFLTELPKIYQNNHDTDSALGTALLIAGKLLHPTGGRVTVIQTRIPNINPGALNEQIGKEPTVLVPTSDFYKKLSLDYASQQIACDLFLLNNQYIDLTTLSCISKYSAGEVKYYPGFHSVQTPDEVERFEGDLRRYFQRKIGFEAVMRLRSPPTLSIQTFFGNGFVRSVDLLVLPNVNPDAAFGMQVSIDESLTQYKSVTFQVAILYTSSKGERRIRVHTLSLPVSNNLTDICSNADQEAIVSLIAKMAADRCTTGSIQEAREAMSNVACDILKASSTTTNSANRGSGLVVPRSLRLIPLYMLSMMKSTAFRAGSVTRVDDRAYYIDLCKTLPTQYLMQIFYPDLYPIHTIEEKTSVKRKKSSSQIVQDGDEELYIPHRVQLSFQHIDSHGAYVLDASEYIYIYIGKAISDHFVKNVFNLQTFSALPMCSYSLPDLDNPLSIKIHNFLTYLIQNRPHGVAIHIMREDSPNRYLFTRYLVDDKSESTMSYVEFLQYIRGQIGK